MNDFNRLQKPRTNTICAAGALALLSSTVTWPTQEGNYKIEQDTPSFSFFENSLSTDTQLSQTPQNFTNQLVSIFTKLCEDQIPLGSEFEAIWDANIPELYES